MVSLSGADTCSNFQGTAFSEFRAQGLAALVAAAQKEASSQAKKVVQLILDAIQNYSES